MKRFQPQAILALSFLLAATPAAKAAEKTPQRIEAERLYAQALDAELQGDLTTRAAKLKAAVANDPDFAPARWRLGEVQNDTQTKDADAAKWTSYSDAIQRWQADPRLAQYVTRRAAAAKDDVESNTALAKWSASVKLEVEARHHWTRVAEERQNDADALRKAGLRRAGNRIVSFQTFDKEAAAKRAANEAADVWRPRISRLIRDRSSADQQRASAAAFELLSIRDPAAIPTLEAALSLTDSKQPFRPLEQSSQVAKSTELNREFIAILRAMPEPEASKALVREAVLSPSEDVRSAAIAALAERPWHHFVPRLLEGLVAPIEAKVSVKTDIEGRIHYRKQFFREGPDTDRAVTYDALFEHFAIDVEIYPEGVQTFKELGPVPQHKSLQIAKDAAATHIAVQNWNSRLTRLNGRIYTAAIGSTKTEVAEKPGDWWRWWKEYNELYIPEDKPIAEKTYSNYYATQDVSVYNYNYPPTSCFVAGTPVMTKTGLKAIETIRIGDFVLAQDSETGELAFKPVIRRTTRPPAPIVSVGIGSEAIRVTRGHCFWVAGANWVRAKQLNTGDRIHTPNGPVTLTNVSSAADEATYNLVVADFHNYFVGERMLLVHDNTPTTPTARKLPGL